MSNRDNKPHPHQITFNSFAKTLSAYMAEEEEKRKALHFKPNASCLDGLLRGRKEALNNPKKPELNKSDALPPTTGEAKCHSKLSPK